MCNMLRFTAGLTRRIGRGALGGDTAEQTFWQNSASSTRWDPAPLVYQDFEQYVRLGDGVTADRLFELAAECFTGRRGPLEPPRAEPRGGGSGGLDKTAAATRRRRAGDGGARDARGFAFAAHHPTFPTVKLVRGG